MSAIFRPAVAVVAAAFLMPLIASAQAGGPATSERAIRDLADLAPAAPPELGADVLLKLIERGYILDPKSKRETLEKAWSLAAAARHPFEIEPAVMTATNSDPETLSTALAIGLSMAGIQGRIITEVAKLDATTARDLFSEMSPPAVETPTCSQDRYTSHRAYFQALTSASQTFSPEETKAGERFRFIAEALRSLSNPEDFELSLDLLRRDRSLSNSQLAELMSGWSDLLARARFSDRLFSSRSIEPLATTLLSGGKEMELRGTSMAPALRAFRSYFVNHARAARCGESQSKADEEEAVRVAFNKRVALIAPDVPTITPEDIKGEGFGEKAKVAVYSSSEDGSVREMSSDYTRLRFASEDQRGTAEWTDEALQFLHKVERWSPESGQSSRETFFRKAEWHSGLVYAAPEGKLRQLFLDRYVQFLTSSPIERESPPEWSMWVNRLIAAAEIPDRRAWLNQIEGAGDPAIAVYCRLAGLVLGGP